jgi:hypothetical protein
MSYNEAMDEWVANGRNGDAPNPQDFEDGPRGTPPPSPFDMNSPEDKAWQASYQNWIKAGATGSPPERPVTNVNHPDHPQKIQAMRDSAIAGVQNSSLAGAYDMAGTNANAPKVGGFNDLVSSTPGMSDTATARPSVGTSQSSVLSSNPGVLNTQSVTGPIPATTGMGPFAVPPPNSGPQPLTPSPSNLVLGPAAGTGFNNLAPGGMTQPTVPAVILPGGNGPTTPTGSTGPQAGRSYSYTDLLKFYKQENPDKPAPSGDEFNAWTGSKGITGWSEVPAGTPNVYTNPELMTQDTPNAPAVDGNYRQNQQGSQTGNFATVGGSNFAQNQVTGQNTQQNTSTTNQQQVGTQTAQDTTQRTNTGQNTTGQVTNNQTTGTSVQDTLGFGDLLKGQAGAAQTADATRQGFLQDLVQTGGSNLNSQVDQAVRNSLTGPQMTGAGDSARARAAGYAAAEIGRRNTGDRLSAASQLAGPTATQSLVQAGTPFLGQTQTTSGVQGTNMNTTGFQDLVSQVRGTGQQNTTGSGTSSATGSQTGFSNTAGGQTEAQSGSASGRSTQSASGQVPEGQTQTAPGGGCIICTAGLHHGTWRRPRLLRRVVAYKIVHNWPTFRHAARGYFFLFGPIASLALRSRLVSRLTMPVANAVVYEEARLAGVDLPFRTIPWAAHWTWHGLCSAVGRLPVPNHVTDKGILAVAKKFNVFFKVGV